MWISNGDEIELGNEEANYQVFFLSEKNTWFWQSDAAYKSRSIHWFMPKKKTIQNRYSCCHRSIDYELLNALRLTIYFVRIYKMVYEIQIKSTTRSARCRENQGKSVNWQTYKRSHTNYNGLNQHTHSCIHTHIFLHRDTNPACKRMPNNNNPQ